MCIYLSFYIPLFSIVFFLLFFFSSELVFFFSACARQSVCFLFVLVTASAALNDRSREN